MGGLIGMAALPKSPIGRLVLNDIGPAIDAAGLVRDRRLPSVSRSPGPPRTRPPTTC
jgi:hypothetical protein